MSTKKNIIFILVFVLIIGIIYFSASNRTSTVNQDTTDVGINNFNIVLDSVLSEDDIEKCEELSKGDLQENCKSQLKDRFSQYYSATNVSQCMNNTDGVSKDVCILNVAIKKGDFNDAILDCTSIQTEDIKQSCLAQVQPTNE